MYYPNLTQHKFIESPLCYLIKNDIVPVQEASPGKKGNAVLDVDCFYALGGENKDAAFFRVVSVPRNGSKGQPWQSHLLVDSVEKGIPSGALWFTLIFRQFRSFALDVVFTKTICSHLFFLTFFCFF